MNIRALEDASAESTSPFAGVDSPAAPAHDLSGHVCRRQILTKATAVSRIVERSKHGYDLFLNLSDESIGTFPSSAPAGAPIAAESFDRRRVVG